jgi:hypothetical protein
MRDAKMINRQLLAAALALGVTAAGAAGAQDAHTPAKGEHTPCFFISQWRGWKAPNDHTLYLGVNFRDVYEVQLSAGSSTLQDPDAHLVSVTRGSDSVCSALDLQLAVAEPYGFKEPLIARSLVKLTPDEVAAIPRKYRPY